MKTRKNNCYSIRIIMIIMGMVVLLCPLYLGWDYGDEGWGAEVKSADPSELRSWGQYVGKRYADDDNIIWCIGGDTNPLSQKDKVLECVKVGRQVTVDLSKLPVISHFIFETIMLTFWK